MQYVLSVKASIQRTLLGDYSTLSVLLGITALLLSLGFIFGNIEQNTNYALLWILGSKLQWALSFGSYGTLKLYCAVRRTWFSLKMGTTLYGLWLWNYLALSFTLFDKTALAPTELMLFVLVVAELWVLTLILYNRKYFRR